MQNLKMTKRFSVILLVLASLAQPLLFAQNESYDRYGSAQKTSEKSAVKKIASNLLTYPLEIPRWLINQGLFMTEKYRLDMKARWIYEKILEQGITPSGNLLSPTNLGGGLDIDYMKLTRFNAELPDLKFRSWFNWNKNTIFETGSEAGVERIAGTGFRAFGLFQYESRPEEHFHGIGRYTSAGNGTSYKMEVTTLEGRIGYSTSPKFSADLKLDYQNINITDGEDGGRGIIDTTFPAGSVPGLEGDNLLTYKLELVHDTRNRDESSTVGGREKVSFGYVEGINDSDAGYFKYQVELSRYFRLWSDRRVFVIHFYGEENKNIAGRDVPFHQMAKLGGYGEYPRLSHTLRGYDNNRYTDQGAALFNFEYRYAIWEHKDFKLDTVVFVDSGQVFAGLRDFKFSGFKESFGAGTRLSMAGNVVFALEVARSNEGTEFYAKSSSPF